MAEEKIAVHLTDWERELVWRVLCDARERMHDLWREAGGLEKRSVRMAAAWTRDQIDGVIPLFEPLSSMEDEDPAPEQGGER